MIIYVDGTALFRKPDGVGRYSSSLLSALIDIDNKNEYRVLGFVDDIARHHAIAKNRIKYEYLPVPRQAYNQWFKRVGPVSVNRWLRKKPDIVIYPNFVRFPKIKEAKSVLVIHDLTYLETPETISKPNLKYMSRFVPRAIEKSDAVVAVSNETQTAIAKNYTLNASDITVVPNAVDNKFFRRQTKETVAKVQGKYGLPDEYILHVGTIEPRKNIGRLLEAYTQLPASLRDKYPLVLAGKPGWENEEVYKQIQKLMSEGHAILIVGFVEDEDLPALFQKAKILAFPSLHEGFGLPILEAFAGRTPVVTSNLAPMNRIAEDAAEFFNPEQPDSITSAINKVLSSNQLQKTMALKGENIAKKHRWENSAQIMLEILENMAS